jgi:hypothetical protein
MINRSTFVILNILSTKIIDSMMTDRHFPHQNFCHMVCIIPIWGE